jgi:hypothetical protein
MKVPGRAWLEFTIRDSADGTRTFTQTAYYFPGSIWGKLYWYMLLPLHYFVFAGMAHNIVKWAEQEDRGAVSVSQPS